MLHIFYLLFFYKLFYLFNIYSSLIYTIYKFALNKLNYEFKFSQVEKKK